VLSLRRSDDQLSDHPPSGPRHSSGHSSDQHRRVFAAPARVLAVLGLAVASITATPAAQADIGYQRGPAPTLAGLYAERGPFATAELGVSRQWSFGGGRIYYPTDSSAGRFGAVAIAPGFGSTWSRIAWLGPRIASHGFVVFGVEMTSTYDFPYHRGVELLAALDYLVSDPRVNNRIDRDRLAVAGWSMGGGGALQAAQLRSSLRAAIPIAPWHYITNWSGDRVPTLIIGAENDAVAPVAWYAEPFYAGLTATPDKAYLEINNALHDFTASRNDLEAATAVAWLKRFVDDDTRYEEFLCPGPQGPAVQEYRQTCPNA